MQGDVDPFAYGPGADGIAAAATGNVQRHVLEDHSSPSALVPSTDRGVISCGDLADAVNAPDGPARGLDPDHEWAVGFVRSAITTDRADDEVLKLVTYGISGGELDGAVTLAALEEAFRRILRRLPPPEWIDSWVGQPSKPLRRLDEDLIHGEEFRRRRQRLS